MSFSSGTGGRKHNAASTAANGTAWLFGGLLTILCVGPAYNLLSQSFIDHVVSYYGESFAGIAALFLFVMLLSLIFMLSTFTTHILVESIRAKIILLLATFKGRN